MKKSIFFAVALLAAVGLSSCSKSLMTASSPVYSLTNSQVSNGYLETKLEEAGEVSVEVSGKFKRIGSGIVGNNHSYVLENNSLSKFMGKTEKIKAMALYEATKKADCDIILAPIYTVTTKSQFLMRDKFTVKVTGTGANIVGVKQIAVDPNKK
ncbi:MAG: hypothetical protein SNG02_01415 [Rikenellaceae bacterium]